jgi:hypothetical protein
VGNLYGRGVADARVSATAAPTLASAGMHVRAIYSLFIAYNLLSQSGLAISFTFDETPSSEYQATRCGWNRIANMAAVPQTQTEASPLHDSIAFLLDPEYVQFYNKHLLYAPQVQNQPVSASRVGGRLIPVSFRIIPRFTTADSSLGGNRSCLCWSNN